MVGGLYQLVGKYGRGMWPRPPLQNDSIVQLITPPLSAAHSSTQNLKHTTFLAQKTSSTPPLKHIKLQAHHSSSTPKFKHMIIQAHQGSSTRKFKHTTSLCEAHLQLITPPLRSTCPLLAHHTLCMPVCSAHLSPL